MKLSDLILKAQEAYQRHGDLDVMALEYGRADYCECGERRPKNYYPATLRITRHPGAPVFDRGLLRPAQPSGARVVKIEGMGR